MPIPRDKSTSTRAITFRAHVVAGTFRANNILHITLAVEPLDKDRAFKITDLDGSILNFTVTDDGATTEIPDALAQVLASLDHDPAAAH